jgi:hypothetical protein
MGVYWETEKPVWNGNTNNGNLVKGLIRLVGRYWTKDSTYIVNLTAKQDKDSSSIKIKIIKPSELGLKYKKSKDVQNHDINIDSLCIKFGGERHTTTIYKRSNEKRN